MDVMMHLALGQLTSLGLNQDSTRGFPNYLRELRIDSSKASRTLEERRAYLGCYYLSSMYVMRHRPVSAF